MKILLGGLNDKAGYKVLERHEEIVKNTSGISSSKICQLFSLKVMNIQFRQKDIH